MALVVDYSLEWNTNPGHPDAWRIFITTQGHPAPFPLAINSAEEFLAATHMLGKAPVDFKPNSGVLKVMKRIAGS